MKKPTPWAILLIKWKDSTVEPQPRAFFENLFTKAGTGSFNMTDYFETMSHGTLDVSGNAVHGWFTLDQPQTEYGKSIGRNDLVALARAKASENGVNLSVYSGVVVCMNTSTDLCGWIGGMQALCSDGSFQPSVLGQEMGHGYGLNHSRLDGSTDDYQDPWDTMSTWDGCFMAGDPTYTLIGPGLNAANMRYMGWLDESRVWKSSASSVDQQIDLRPLHDTGSPGHLAAEVGGFLIEFRVPEDWDSAIPRPAVFVHRLQDGYSYRMLSTGGNSDLVKGEQFTSGNPLAVFSPFTSIHVDDINEQHHVAKITIKHKPKLHIPVPVFGPGQIFGGVEVDGGGVIVVGGVPHPVGPWGPLTGVLSHLVAHSTAERIADPVLRVNAKRDALARIVDLASQALGELNELESPPPLKQSDHLKPVKRRG